MGDKLTSESVLTWSMQMMSEGHVVHLLSDEDGHGWGAVVGTESPVPHGGIRWRASAGGRGERTTCPFPTDDIHRGYSLAAEAKEAVESRLATLWMKAYVPKMTS